MILSRAKRFLLIIAASLAAATFSTSSFGADVSEKGTGSQKVDPQADKQKLIESRKEQNQKTRRAERRRKVWSQ